MNSPADAVSRAEALQGIAHLLDDKMTSAIAGGGHFRVEMTGTRLVISVVRNPSMNWARQEFVLRLEPAGGETK